MFWFSAIFLSVRCPVRCLNRTKRWLAALKPFGKQIISTATVLVLLEHEEEVWVPLQEVGVELLGGLDGLAHSTRQHQLLDLCNMFTNRSFLCHVYSVTVPFVLAPKWHFITIISFYFHRLGTFLPANVKMSERNRLQSSSVVLKLQVPGELQYSTFWKSNFFK